MKPLRLEIKDFGAIPYITIDLANITMAAICGSNGAGKSTAFTIAPRFALYGAVKAGCSIDDMVRTGAQEAAVSFDFEHHGAVWRVIRTRSTKGKGKTTLELQKQAGSEWNSESGASIAETQKKIIRLLNLDDDTFVCSSMILQNKANEFTSRPAGQRKAILAQILQLDQYEALQDKAKAKAQAVSIALEKCKSRIGDINRRLADRNQLESEKLQAEIELAGLERALTQLETDLQVAQLDFSAFTVKIEQVDKMRQQAEALTQTVVDKSAERDRQQNRLDTAQQLLSQEALVLSKVAEYETTKDQVTVLKTKQEQQQTLKAEAERLKTELTGVDVGLTKAIVDIGRIEATLADRPRLEQSKVNFDQATTRLAICQEELAEDKRLQELTEAARIKLFQTEERYLNQENDHKQKIATLEAKTAMLADANCVDIDRAQCKFLADAVQAKAELPAARETYQTWKVHADAEITELQQVVKEAELARTEYRSKTAVNPLEPYELQEKLQSLKPDVDLLAQLAAMEPLLDNLRAQRRDYETRQTDINTRLDSLRQQYKELSDGLKDLPELETKLQQLAPWLKSKEQLPAAREVAVAAGEMVDRLKSEIETAQTQAAALKTEYDQLIGNSVELKAQAEQWIQQLKSELTAKRTVQNQTVGRLGSLSAKLEALDQDEIQRVEITGEMEPLAKTLTRWQTLVKAFSNNGIPALIIENAVPELERIANEILGQMTNGKNFLKFETQRELKSRSGMAETLDIIVGDWAGERIYETFSGGEQLRIDFAIRFALAELLARRAGDRVDWLTIDEGFGSQSEDYLPGVIEAVKAVADRFGIVLIISHVKAVQEAFEQKIVFEPAEQSIDVMVA